jgi:SAM-dependent methyltransferase/alkylhydroperoxidase/carboxymuconolactone decarboxylase family protein YurZ
MDENATISGKEKILIALAAAMGGGCRTCAQGLRSMADSAGATIEEIERAFTDGLLQRERATEVMRGEASALLGRPLDAGSATGAAAEARVSELSRLAASVASNSSPDALKRLDAARSTGAAESEIRVAIGIGRSVRAKAQGFSDAEIGESREEEASCGELLSDPAAAPMKPLRKENPDEIREAVKQDYTRVVQQSTGCCGSGPTHPEETARRIGYSDEELEAAPEGANLGVGCGNPTALASLRPGEGVVDLGSGAGFDAFLAARAVGGTGRVIGVDMTDAMLEKARENARAGGVTNAEFRKGTIEALPIEDESVDVIISNCVINLSPEKDRVFREAFRVLRPGGRLMISDIVLERPLPLEISEDIAAHIGCVGGASVRAEYLDQIAKAGFRDVSIVREADVSGAYTSEKSGGCDCGGQVAAETGQLEAFLRNVTSVHVQAVK